MFLVYVSIFICINLMFVTFHKPFHDTVVEEIILVRISKISITQISLKKIPLTQVTYIEIDVTGYTYIKIKIKYCKT